MRSGVVRLVWAEPGPGESGHVGEPGAELRCRLADLQLGPGGQTPGKRFSGDDVTDAVLHALDGATGKELYSSKDLSTAGITMGALPSRTAHLPKYLRGSRLRVRPVRIEDAL